MGHHHDLSANNKIPDVLEISLTEVISPVVSSQLYMVQTPVAGITWKNQSMLVETDQGAALCPNSILTYIDLTSFCIYKSVFQLPSKW